MAKLQNLYEMFARAAASLQSPFLLLVRVYWGWQMAQTGWGKLGDLGKVTEYFGSLGIPLPALNADFIAGLEFVGGILLAVGLGSRIIAFLLTCDMAVAYWLGDHDALLSFFSAPDKFTAAAPFVFLMASLIVLIFGPGKIAIDTFIAKRFGRQQTPTPASIAA